MAHFVCFQYFQSHQSKHWLVMRQYLYQGYASMSVPGLSSIRRCMLGTKTFLDCYVFVVLTENISMPKPPKHILVCHNHKIKHVGRTCKCLEPKMNVQRRKPSCWRRRVWCSCWNMPLLNRRHQQRWQWEPPTTKNSWSLLHLKLLLRPQLRPWPRKITATKCTWSKAGSLV